MAKVFTDALGQTQKLPDLALGETKKGPGENSGAFSLSNQNGVRGKILVILQRNRG